MARFTASIWGFVLLIVFGISSASARMYYLPDYQNSTFPKRVNDFSSADKPVFSPNLRSCSDYSGFMSATDKGNMDCNIVKYFPQVGTCYSDCKCNTDKFPYNSANCSYELTGANCIDTNDNSYYEDCDDPCAPFTDIDCNGLRCKETYVDDGCDTKCKVCYESACDYPENAEYPLKDSCEYDCDTTGTVEGCDTKCHVCATCAPNDCTGYELDNCPANASCESCDIGCDLGTKYKISSCNSGYEQNGNTCVASSCASGYATSVSNCGSSFSNGSWVLGTTSNGYSGSSKCYKCTRKCNSGYGLSGNTCVACDFSGYTLSSCPSNGTCTSKTCGGITKYELYSCKTRYELSGTSCVCASNYKVAPNGKGCYEDTTGELSLTYNLPANIKMEFSITAYYGQIDWGDGTVEEITGDDTTISHTYLTAGDYKITMTGDIASVNRINHDYTSYIKEFHNLNLSSVTSLSGGTNSTFGSCSKAEGGFPQLPPKLSDAGSLFMGCSKLSGNVPELPNSLKYAGKMFQNCKAMDGTISYLPENLSSVNYMFDGCTNLTGSIPMLPPRITSAYSMFNGCNNLIGNIPELPSGLQDGQNMFNGCSGLTGNIPKLPSGLTKVSRMFSGCSNLTGSIPALPTVITDGLGMFDGCSGLTGTIPPLPSGLQKAGYMFRDCRNLTGEIPELPSGLQTGTYMFYGCLGLSGTINSLPNSITNTMYMFTGCLNLEGSPTRPSSIQSSSGTCTKDAYTFDCTKVTNDGTWNGTGSCAFTTFTDCSLFE